MTAPNPTSTSRRTMVVMIAASLLAGFLISEIAVRIVDHSDPDVSPVSIWTVRNFALDRLTMFRSGMPAEYDDELGWVPKAGFRQSEAHVHHKVTIDERGLRRNGEDVSTSTRAGILVVGDSFAFGDEVNDEDTWPSILERRVRRPVWNGGVFAYGIDQTELRAERLTRTLSPEVILFQLIPADAGRTQLATRNGAPKPYFLIEGDALVLKNTPVPKERPDPQDIGLLRGFLGYSYLVDFLMRRIGWAEWWYVGNWPHLHVHDRGLDVSCMLLKRFAEFARERSIRAIVVTQYSPRAIMLGPRIDEAEIGQGLIGCALRAGLESIDTFQALRARVEADPKEISALYSSHLTPQGNRIVAELIARALDTLPRP
jgi:hypothetical protein